MSMICLTLAWLVITNVHAFDRINDGPTKILTDNPTIDPTKDPTTDPTIDPTRGPTHDPTITVHGTQFVNIGQSLTSSDGIISGKGLLSNNGRFTAVMQPDGDFVIYDLNDGETQPNGRALWATNTGQPQDVNYWMNYQSDGNFVLYGNSAALWASNTDGTSPGSVSMQVDGNLVVYDSARDAKWASGTNIASIQVNGILFNNVGSKLFVNGSLNRIYTNESLVSVNRRYVAAMQLDGNFVIYDLQKQIALWETNTAGGDNPIGRFMAYQPDGNFVLYEANWSPVWASNTHGTTVGLVYMQNDGNLVVYDQSGVLRWASNTSQSAAIFYGGWLVGILIVLNIIYMMFYCYKNKMRSKKGAGYKVVSIDSTDCDEDGIDIENRILVNNK